MCCLTLLPKLLASSYVVMLGRGEKASFLCHSRAFAFHKRAYEPVVTASMPQGSLAGRTEDHRLAASLQVEQAVACAVVVSPLACWSRRRCASSPPRVPWTPFWHALCTCRRSVPCTRSSCLQGAPPRWCTCLWHGLLGALRRVPRPRRFSRASLCRPRGPFWRYAGTARCSSAGRVRGICSSWWTP